MPDNITPMPPRAKEEKGSSGFLESKERLIPIVVPSPVKVYTTNIGRRRAPELQWEAPEWDLAECGRIIDTEAYIRRAFAVKEALFLKEGWEFTGHNHQRVAYIKKRLRQMQHAGGVPFEILLSWTVNSLIRTSNAFWVKKRDFKASGGKRRQNEKNKTIDPIAAYFPAPAETIRFKRDEYGKIVAYTQNIRGKESAEFSPDDVIHFFFDKREGFSVGTPVLVPIKDDIRALRRIEENVELLVYQHLFPLFHYKVGTETAPAMIFPDGTTEIDVVRDGIANMPADGCWVTPERHSIEVVGAEGEALKVKDVIEHFKQRIFTGLGVSTVDMGEGGTANRSTAKTMSRNLIDRTKAEQNEVAAFINKYVIEELLQESTFDQETLFEEENVVKLRFKEIDQEARIALENHLSQMYLQHYLTHDQMRIAGGEEPWTDEDWEKSYWRQIDEPTKLMQSLDEPYSAEAKAVARSNTTSITEEDIGEEEEQKEKERKEELAVKKISAQKKPQALGTRKSSSKTNKAGANKNRPANQHGTRRAPKLNKDLFNDADERSEVLKNTSLQSIFLQAPPISTAFRDIREALVSQIRYSGWDYKRAELLIGITFEEARARLASHARRSYRYGIQDTGMDYFNMRLDTRDAQIEQHLNRYVHGLRDEVLAHLKRGLVENDRLNNENATLAKIMLDALEHRTKMIDESEIMRAYNTGRADSYRKQGAEIIEITTTDSQPCEICRHSTLQWTEADAIIYEELPPLHPMCRCLVRARG
jgi:hypothetical protein